MASLEIEDERMPAYDDPIGFVRAGYGVFYNCNLIGTIDLDATNNWCAYPLDAPPLTSTFTDRWDAAMWLVRFKR